MCLPPSATQNDNYLLFKNVLLVPFKDGRPFIFVTGEHPVHGEIDTSLYIYVIIIIII